MRTLSSLMIILVTNLTSESASREIGTKSTTTIVPLIVSRIIVPLIIVGLILTLVVGLKV